MTTSADFEQQMPSIWGLAHCPSDSTTNNISTNSTSNGQYTSTVVVDSVHVAICVSSAMVLFLCFSGVHKVTMRGTLDTIKQILPCFRDMDHGATSNTRFILYYFLSAMASLLTIVALLLDQNDVPRGYRIAMQVGQRVFSGAAAVLLTIALNHQREHRHHDALHGDIGIVQLVGQIRRINYAVVVIFSIYIVAELGTSFVTSSHGLRVAMAAVAFIVIVILNLPIVAAAAWVAFHKGHIAPKLPARIALMLGVVLRFVGTIDASFWNKLVLSSWTDHHPCALGGDLSFYNMLEILNLIGQMLLLGFVVSEFRKSRSIVTQESSLIATAQYDDFDDGNSSNPSEGDLQRSPSSF